MVFKNLRRVNDTPMAVWSRMLPLTARCLSPLPGYQSQPGHVRKFPVTYGLAVVFAGYSGFLHQLLLASHDLAVQWQKK